MPKTALVPNRAEMLHGLLHAKLLQKIKSFAAANGCTGFQDLCGSAKTLFPGFNIQFNFPASILSKLKKKVKTDEFMQFPQLPFPLEVSLATFC